VALLAPSSFARIDVLCRVVRLKMTEMSMRKIQPSGCLVYGPEPSLQERVKTPWMMWKTTMLALCSLLVMACGDEPNIFTMTFSPGTGLTLATQMLGKQDVPSNQDTLELSDVGPEEDSASKPDAVNDSKGSEDTGSDDGTPVEDTVEDSTPVEDTMEDSAPAEDVTEDGVPVEDSSGNVDSGDDTGEPLPEDTAGEDGGTPFCGDGKVDPDEACDDGVNDGSYGGCNPDCGALGPHCGDGDVNGEEACDDGTNDGSYDGCTADCAALGPHCGDGNLNGEEVCDDGTNDGSYDGCTADCASLGPHCGDGDVNGDEVCDSKGETATCDGDCTPATCGDAWVNTLLGEECDDGNAQNSDDCTGICQWAVCGDGIIHTDGETCDDGNSIGGDGCGEACAAIEVGNTCHGEPSVCVPAKDVLHVGAGQEYADVAGALKNASDGSVLFIHAGKHSVAATINDQDVVLVGEEGSVLSFSGDKKVLTIQGNSNVKIIGLTLTATGNSDVLKIEDNAEVLVFNSTIGPSKKKGIEVKDNGVFTMRAGTVVGNTGGGIRLKDNADYDIRHTFIVDNGSGNSPFGGVEFRNNAAGEFVFNTVASNTTQNGVPGGVKCTGEGQKIERTIVWDNKNAEVSGSCKVDDLDNNIQGGGISGNLNQDPLFVSGDDFHLSGDSPCRDQIQTIEDADKIDVDLQPRPLGNKADIGADEAVP
jgi:cysteine-rich repeat protein